MKSIVMTFAALAALFASAAFAGDKASLNVVGFSADGNYFAYEEYGIQDGSGMPYSSIYFLDVVRNSYAVNPIHVVSKYEENAMTLGQTRRKAMSEAQPKLAAFAINGLDEGDQLQLDAGEKKEARVWTDMRDNGGYTLKIAEEHVKSEHCAFHDEGAAIFKLTLRNDSSGAVRTLQQDRSLPPSRGCALGYTFEQVLVHGPDRIVVLLATQSEGFEGPDTRYLAVSGKLN